MNGLLNTYSKYSIFNSTKHILIWIGNPNNCLRVAGGRKRSLFSQRETHLFWKGTFWGPQAMFTAEQLAAYVFVFNTMTCIFGKTTTTFWYLFPFFNLLLSMISQHLQIINNICQCTVLRTYLPTIRYCVRYERDMYMYTFTYREN